MTTKPTTKPSSWQEHIARRIREAKAESKDRARRTQLAHTLGVLEAAEETRPGVTVAELRADLLAQHFPDNSDAKGGRYDV